MRRELFVHFSFWFSFFVFVTLIRHYFSLSYWPFWLGGMVGIFLPDLDHVIYAYFLNPNELTSQRLGYLVDKRQLIRSIELLYETRGERTGLIFHTVFFQMIFLILTFWIMSSSGSYFGRGLVLSFALHLSIDQVVDLVDLGRFDNWMKSSPIKLDFSQAKVYCGAVIALICVFGFLM
jgi:hypothetical protein